MLQALLSLVLGCEIPRCLPLVSRLSEFFPFCGLSYLGLITGSDVDEMTRTFVAGKVYKVTICCPSHLKICKPVLIVNFSFNLIEPVCFSSNHCNLFSFDFL